MERARCAALAAWALLRDGTIEVSETRTFQQR